MDHAESIAQRLFEAVLIDARMEYCCDQSQGQHDFDLRYSDGRVAAVEVTSAANEQRERTNAAITDKRKGARQSKPNCANGTGILTLVLVPISIEFEPELMNT